MIKHQMFIAAALLAGVAIGYFVKDDSAPAEEPKAARPAETRAVADRGGEASVRALRHRIAELERMLAERDGNSEAAISNAVAEAAKMRPPEPPRRNWRERMEEMKKNDPERYAEMTNRMAQWRQEQSARAHDKIGFLSAVDTSRMSAEAKRTHAELQELIVRREEIEARLQNAELPDEERGKLTRELWDSHRELQRLNDAERRNLIGETAKSLGFSGEDAKEFSEAIQGVIDATDGSVGRRRGGHHGGGPGGRGGR